MPEDERDLDRKSRRWTVRRSARDCRALLPVPDDRVEVELFSGGCPIRLPMSLVLLGVVVRRSFDRDRRSRQDDVDPNRPVSVVPNRDDERLDLVLALGDRTMLNERDDVVGARLGLGALGGPLDDKDRLPMDMRFGVELGRGLLDIEGVLGRGGADRLMDGLVGRRLMEKPPREGSDELRLPLVLGRNEMLGRPLDVLLLLDIRLGLLRLIDGRETLGRDTDDGLGAVADLLGLGAGREAWLLELLRLLELRFSVPPSTTAPISRATVTAKATAAALGSCFSATANIAYLLSLAAVTSEPATPPSQPACQPYHALLYRPSFTIWVRHPAVPQ